MNFRIRDTEFQLLTLDKGYDFPICKRGVNGYWSAQQMVAVDEYTMNLPEAGCVIWNNIRAC